MTPRELAALDRWITSSQHHEAEQEFVCLACETEFTTTVEIEYGRICSMPSCPLCQCEHTDVT